MNAHAHSRDSWAHEATLPMPWVRFGERRCTSLAQTLFDGKTHTLQGTDLARQEPGNGAMPPQRRENLQRKSRRMPMHIRGIRGPTKRHWPANPRRGRRLLNGKVESTNGGRTYRGKASESPRTPAGFVSLRGGICQPNLRCGRRPVNEAVKPSSGGRIDGGKACGMST